MFRHQHLFSILGKSSVPLSRMRGSVPAFFQLYFHKHGIPAQFTLRDAAQDKEKVRRFVAEAKAARPDLIVAWGTSVALETVGAHDAVDPARHIADIPVLFMIVSQPVSSGIVKSLASPGRNVSGVLYLLAETLSPSVRYRTQYIHLFGCHCTAGKANTLTATA